MNKILAATAAALSLAAFLLPANALATCPASYTCGFSVGQAHAIDGSPNSAEPQGIIGTISFDSSRVPTINFVANSNGTVKPSASETGTCSSTVAGAGTLTFPAVGGGSFSLTYVQPSGTNELLVIGDTGSSTVSDVNAGICEQAATLAACPTSGSCTFTAAGAQPLTSGSATQGQPQVILGTISFAGATNSSFSGEVNNNGINTALPATTGSCAVDSTTGIMTLDFTGGGGPKLDLVAAGSGYRAIGLGTAVTVGACVP